MDKCMGQGQTDRQTRTTRIMGAISAPRKLRPSFPRALPLWYLDFCVDSKFVGVAPKGSSVRLDFAPFHFYLVPTHIFCFIFGLANVGFSRPQARRDLRSERASELHLLHCFLFVRFYRLPPPGHLASPLVMQMPCLKGTGAVAPRKRPLYVCTAQMRR